MASAKVLLLVNYRPEYRPEWGNKTYYTQVRLAPFGTAEAEEFLDVLLGHDLTLATLKHQILTKTEGIPFFMEEVVQRLVEDGSLAGAHEHYALVRQVSTLQLPTTVQGVLATRIGRLAPEEKALLQQLAVIGRELPLCLIRHVLSQSEEELYRLLASLQRKEFLYEQPTFPEVEYLFKHALTQEVAYGSVLHERRKALHERTAQAMEILYRATLDEHYSDLAHHYSRSDNTPKAIEYLHHAGQQAVQRSAHTEAVTHFTTALELLQTLPDTLERTQQELALQLALALPLIATQGFGAPEVGAVRARSLRLSEQVGESPQLFPALWGAQSFYLVRAELQTARDVSERLLSLAQQAQNSALLLDTHFALGTVSYSCGEWVAARAHCEHAVALHDPGQWRAAIARSGIDFGIPSLPYLANVLWVLGYPDQALCGVVKG